MKFRSINISFLLVIFCSVMLLLTVRGLPGNPTTKMLNQAVWRDNGPFELSPERGKYALLYSMVEEKSLHFSADLARFVAPDVGYINGHYVSLFAPGVSFICLPGYIIGRYFGLAQVGSFLEIALFALFNFWLIRTISIKIGADRSAANLAGLIFLFATPAFAYAVTLYQHHISTFLILLSIWILMKWRSFFAFFIVWFLFALSVMVDNPNFFMMLPVAIFSLYRTFSFERVMRTIKISLPILRIIAVSGMLIPILLFMWFNYVSYGNPLQLAGTTHQITKIDSQGKPVFPSRLAVEIKEQSNNSASNGVALTYFKNRNITNGMYEFFFSQDRGMLLFTPVILFGFLGFVWAMKRDNKYTLLLFSVLSVDIVLYSMWGDPYGGWAFGSRYLIPGYAMLAIFIALLLTYLKRNILFLLFFFVVLSYSIDVNALGAITSNRNPPKSESIALEQQYHIPEPYFYDRNIELLNNNVSNSYIFSRYARQYISAWSYYEAIVEMIIVVAGIHLLVIARRRNYD